MEYNRRLNTPQIHKVINVQIAELGLVAIIGVLFTIFGAPRVYHVTLINFSEMPLVRLARWLIYLKMIWGIFNIRFLSKNTLHWYRFI